MKLQNKIALSNLMVGIFAILAIYGLVVMVWVKSYDRLELDLVRENIRRAQSIWNREQETLRQIVSDWAPWDDLYEFARNPQDQKFVKDNLQDSAMMNLRVDIAAVTDSAGKILFTKAIDADKKQETAVPPSLRQFVAPGKSYLDALDNEKSATGILWMDNRPFLLSAQRILRSD